MFNDVDDLRAYENLHAITALRRQTPYTPVLACFTSPQRMRCVGTGWLVAAEEEDDGEEEEDPETFPSRIFEFAHQWPLPNYASTPVTFSEI
jgi:hypothetical protein